MEVKLKILNHKLFAEYDSEIKIDLEKKVKLIKAINLPFNFDFYEASAATYSSNIEGNSTSLDTFLKYSSTKSIKENKEIVEINDLVKAYQFAKKNELTKKNFLQSHKILSKQFLITSAQGKLRKGNVVIAGKQGIAYVAIEYQYLKKEFDLLFYDIDLIIGTKLSLVQALYFSSLIHLIFEKIHPFNDGNGRSGRLLEKWFLSNFIGERAWMIESEKYYFENRDAYYKNLSIGFDYESCDLDKALPFLLMLPKAI